MLVDAAKQGNIEIPYFCYEPKLGAPVGACRMCLVEIEGIPKLQTSCSTPVKDGMVVHTQTDRVHHAQNAIVEFLLVNHPLDCPVCDKGGECPLQDITFGWGLGRSRFIEPKRHFEKPLALSPADRDRPRALHPLLPLRALLAGDRRGLPADLRGARRAHVRRHAQRPSVRRAVQRQHRRAVPGRRADVAAVPLPRAPVGYRGRRRHLHAVPVAVQRRVHGPRREGGARSVPRRHRRGHGRRSRATRTSTTAGCATRAASPTRRSTSTSGSPSRSCATAASCARCPGSGLWMPLPRSRAIVARVGALVGGQATNEEGFLLQRLDARGAATRSDLDSRSGAQLPPELDRALAAPRCRPRSPTWSSRTRCWCSAASRSTTRRSSTCGSARACAGTASSWRSPPPARARSIRTPRSSCACAPGAEAEFLAALDAALASGEAGSGYGSAAESMRRACRAAARRRRGHRDPVGRAQPRRGRTRHAAQHRRSGLASPIVHGAGLLEIPAGANGRGLREAGVLPAPAPATLTSRPRGAVPRRSLTGWSSGQVTALYLFQTDPVRDLPDRGAWERALQRAGLVVAHASVLTEGIAEHANVIFPADSYAEKDGTVVHPDGRIQRMRTAIAHPGSVRVGLVGDRRDRASAPGSTPACSPRRWRSPSWPRRCRSIAA